MSATTAELAQAIIDALQPFVTEAPAKGKAKKEAGSLWIWHD